MSTNASKPLGKCNISASRWSPVSLMHWRDSVGSHGETLKSLIFIRGSSCAAWIVGWRSSGFTRFHGNSGKSLEKCTLRGIGKRWNVVYEPRNSYFSLKVGWVARTARYRWFHWKTALRADLKACYMLPFWHFSQTHVLSIGFIRFSDFAQPLCKTLL